MRVSVFVYMQSCIIHEFHTHTQTYHKKNANYNSRANASNSRANATNSRANASQRRYTQMHIPETLAKTPSMHTRALLLASVTVTVIRTVRKHGIRIPITVVVFPLPVHVAHKPVYHIRQNVFFVIIIIIITDGRCPAGLPACTCNRDVAPGCHGRATTTGRASFDLVSPTRIQGPVHVVNQQLQWAALRADRRIQAA